MRDVLLVLPSFFSSWTTDRSRAKIQGLFFLSYLVEGRKKDIFFPPPLNQLKGGEEGIIGDVPPPSPSPLPPATSLLY